MLGNTEGIVMGVDISESAEEKKAREMEVLARLKVKLGVMRQRLEGIADGLNDIDDRLGVMTDRLEAAKSQTPR